VRRCGKHEMDKIRADEARATCDENGFVH
jgi:hypothetical protein